MMLDFVPFFIFAKQYYITGLKGKGVRLRECPILTKEATDRMLNTKPGQKVWGIVGLGLSQAAICIA